MTNHTAYAFDGRRAVRRVILVVLDGLRPDAIEQFGLRHLAALAGRGAATMEGATVGPSVTAACMASLLTGVPPEEHGLQSSRFHLGRARERLLPLPKLLHAASLGTEAFLGRTPWYMSRIAWAIARALHVSATFAGRESTQILDAALPRLRAMRDGLMILHWPDGDDAGHAHGWMSAGYATAARRMDAELGRVIETVALHERDDTLLIAMADHGGGGADPRDHDSAHPLDRTIPIVFAGGGIVPRTLGGPVSLLDVPPTILSALGLPVPSSYHGRPLAELFDRAVVAA